MPTTKLLVDLDLATWTPPAEPPADWTWESLADLGEVAFAQAMQQAAEGDPFSPSTPESALDDLRELIVYAEEAFDPTGWFVVSDAAGPVGVVLPQPFADVPGEGTLSYVAVHPGRRGHGLGAALHRWGLGLLQQAGTTRYVGSTDERNAPMLAILRRNGTTPRWRQVFDDPDGPPSMVLRVEEPAFGPWRATPVPTLAHRLLDAAGPVGGRPLVIAIDGRSGAGKSWLARRLAEELGGVVLHTDDVAWWEPMFSWGHLVRDGVLAPAHRGEPVDFTPPAWVERGREGSLVVPAGTRVLVVEGVGSAQHAVADLVDAVVWVQSDWREAERRGIERDVAEGTHGDREASNAFWRDWMAHEVAFLAEDRPWTRASVVVNGTPTIGLASDEVAVAP